MSAPAEQQVLQEARRVFRKLADSKARLVRARENWTVVQRGASASGRLKVSARLVEVFRERGWLEPEGESLVLSVAGRNWTLAEVAGLDRFTVQHQRLGICSVRDDDGVERVAIVNEAESPLAWFRSRAVIDDHQFEAGERLRRDYTLAQLQPRLCVDLSTPMVLASRVPGGADIHDTVMAAKQRFNAALTAVGPGLSDLLFDICCALKGLESVEKEKSWPRRSGKVVLGLALDRLAAHYGVRSAPAHSRLRSWSADNLEPAAA